MSWHGIKVSFQDVVFLDESGHMEMTSARLCLRWQMLHRRVPDTCARIFPLGQSVSTRKCCLINYNRALSINIFHYLDEALARSRHNILRKQKSNMRFSCHCLSLFLIGDFTIFLHVELKQMKKRNHTTRKLRFIKSVLWYLLCWMIACLSSYKQYFQQFNWV